MMEAMVSPIPNESTPEYMARRTTAGGGQELSMKGSTK